MRASESPGHNEVLGPKVSIPRAERCVYLHPHWDFSFDSSSSRKEVDLAAITTGGGGVGVGGDALQPEMFPHRSFTLPPLGCKPRKYFGVLFSPNL